MPSLGSHDVSDLRSYVEIGHQLSIYNSKNYFKNSCANRKLFDQCELTLLCQLFQLLQRNEIHGYAYHQQDLDFLLDTFLVAVLNVHCTPKLDPNPRNEQKRKSFQQKGIF